MDAKPPEPVPTVSMNDASASVDTLTPFVPTGPPPTRERRSRWRVAAAVVLATVPLLCVVAIPLAFHSYDTSTRPDRSTPIRAVDNFLHAFLGDPRDDASAGQLTCALPPGVDALRAYRTTVEAGERRTGQDVSFTWVEDDRVRLAGTDSASMTVHIVATIGGVDSPGSESHDWTFTTHLRGQWCVASATELD